MVKQIGDTTHKEGCLDRKKHYRFFLLLISFVPLSLLRLHSDRQMLTENVHINGQHGSITMELQAATRVMKPKKPKRNMLLTAHIPGSPRTEEHQCLGECEATQNALKADTECSARTMGEDWKAITVTNLDEFEKQFQMQLEQQPQQHAWPFSHYVKIHILERLLFGENANGVAQNDTVNGSDNAGYDDDNNDYDIDWMVWVDADVRIVNASYPVSRLLNEDARFQRVSYYGIDDESKRYRENTGNEITGVRGATKSDVSIVVMSQYADNIINNLFFIKNNPWGKRFLLAWKHYTLNAENIHRKKKWKTCGFYDQCPFGVALLQIAHDYYWLQRQRTNDQFLDDEQEVQSASNPLESRLFNSTLEDMAFRSGANIQNTLFKDELNRLMSLQSNTWTNTNVPLQIGPILFLPTWEGGLRLPSPGSISPSNSNGTIGKNDSDSISENTNYYDFIPSSLTIEPTGSFESSYNNTAWPFAIHAKYSKLFRDYYDEKFADFERKYTALHRDQCTPSELSSMWNDTASRWARSIRSTKWLSSESKQ